MPNKTEEVNGRVVLLSFAIVLLGLAGCVTPPPSVPRPLSEVKTVPDIASLYHRVEKGETLWKIARMYGIDMDELVKLNRLPDGSSIEVGQALLLPRRRNNRPALSAFSANEDFIWPLKGKIIGLFGRMYDNIPNRGINIQSARDSSVLAARSGKVTFVSDNFLNLGKTVIIDHGDNFSTLYARNSVVLVKPGDIIERGTIIARVGSAGRNKNEFLHFQIRKGHLAQNPVYYLPR